MSAVELAQLESNGTAWGPVLRTLLVCDLDLAQARAKNREQGDGLYRLDIMNERRPELYTP